MSIEAKGFTEVMANILEAEIEASIPQLWPRRIVLKASAFSIETKTDFASFGHSRNCGWP